MWIQLAAIKPKLCVINVFVSHKFINNRKVLGLSRSFLTGLGFFVFHLQIISALMHTHPVPSSWGHNLSISRRCNLLKLHHLFRKKHFWKHLSECGQHPDSLKLSLKCLYIIPLSVCWCITMTCLFGIFHFLLFLGERMFMLHFFSWQVIEKQHRMMEQLGSQIKVFTLKTFRSKSIH